MAGTGGVLRWTALITSVVTWVIVSLWMALPMGGLGKTGKQLFNWHPLLMTLSVLVFIPQGIFVWRGLNAAGGKGEDLDSTRRRVKIYHALLQMTGFAVANAGIGVAYAAHVQRGVGHFYSLHSWLGLVTLLMMKGNVVGGLLRWWGKKWVGERIRIGHGQVGRLAATIGILTAVTGLVELQVGTWRDGREFGAKSVTSGMVGILVVLVGGGTVATVWRLGTEMQNSHDGQEISSRRKSEADGECRKYNGI